MRKRVMEKRPDGSEVPVDCLRCNLVHHRKRPATIVLFGEPFCAGCATERHPQPMPGEKAGG